MKKRALGLLLALMVLVTALSACGKQDGEPEGTAATNEAAGKYTPGTYEGAAKGYGGDVTVVITVSADEITDVKITGDDETDGIGSKAIEELPAAIKTAQSVDVDVVSGATVTSNAIKTAASEALAKAMGQELTGEGLKMAPGTYTADAQGFAKAERLTVHVTVSEDKLEEIVVDPDNGETKTVLQSAIDLLIPRMIENQSVTIDAITGATVSSNAIKQAVEAAIVQALEAGGSSGDMVRSFYVNGPTKTDEVTLATDVLVVGMGGSGITAAMNAVQAQAEAGVPVSVLGIEKAGKVGGTSALTSSPMAVNPPSMVTENGGDFVDVQEFKADWIDYTEGDAKESLIDVMMEKSGIVLDWMIDLGFQFALPVPGFGTPYQVVCYYGQGLATSKEEVGDYFDAIMNAYTNLGGEYLLEVEGTDLIMNDDGSVAGVKAVGADGTQYTINAKAVILAGGGFAGSAEMEKEYLNNEYYPLNGVWNLYGSHQNDGKTIQMALSAGAGTYNISVPPMVHIGGTPVLMHDYEVNQLDGQIDMWTGRTATWSLNDIPMVMALSPDTMAVGMDGRRFVDESGLAMMDPWKAGPTFWSIWSEARVADVAENGFEYNTTGLFINQGGVPAEMAVPEIYDVLETAKGYGLIYQADTIEELAALISVDPEALKASVEGYNEYCETGVPNGEIEKAARIYSPEGADLGEAHYLKGIGNEGPFYAVAGASWCYSTAGGLDIDENMNVLLADGETIIPGLYAVGTDSIGVLLSEKKEYVKYGGAAQGWAFTSGYVAGEKAAQYVIEE